MVHVWQFIFGKMKPIHERIETSQSSIESWHWTNIQYRNQQGEHQTDFLNH